MSHIEIPHLHDVLALAKREQLAWPGQMDALRASGVPLNMPYDNVISRTDADALIPEDVADEIIKTLPQESAALRLFRRRTMASNQTRMPVLAALPQAYWVNGDTGLKQTTEVNWDNVFLNVEELATIVPIPDAVLEDTNYDLWDEIEPLLREAIGLALDGAVFLDINRPASFSPAIVPAAIAAGNVVTRGTAAAEDGGIAEDFNQLMGAVEADGFDVNGFVTSRSYRRFLRGARDTTGQKLMDMSQNEIEGAPVVYALAGSWPSTTNADAEVIAGDFTQGILGVRRDITMDRSNQGVITDASGAIIYNLWQQDMTAVRVTFRCAWATPNPLTRENASAVTRYPFGVMMGPDETP